MHSPLVVLGGGPGGYAAAFYAADEGSQVTLVESEDRLGGTCLLRGCIPSKALLHAARVLAEVDELRSDWGIEFGPPHIDLARLAQRKNKLISALSTGLKQLAKRRGVTVLRARGSFVASDALRLTGDDPALPEDGRLTFDRCIIATGSRPAIPPLFQIESSRVWNSTQALELVSLPQRLLVVGGGYIGLEMATVYARLGSQVTIVELTDGLLPGVDRDLVKPLHKRLGGLLDGRIRLNTKVVNIEDRGDVVSVGMSGPDGLASETYDAVLVAVGRTPNSRDLGLENTQAVVDARGFIQCTAAQQTADPHLLAIGDVAGEPMLAHKAMHQARTAVECVLGKNAAFDKLAIPAVVFTDPEIAYAGLTEEQAKKQERPIETALYPWAASGRAQALGRTEGLTKWIIEPGSERILGCGIVGVGAGEMISEAVLAIEMGCQVRDLTETVHPHPTLGETLGNAAEAFFGTATEIYKPKRP